MIKNIEPTESTAVPFEHERRFVPDLRALPFDYKGYPFKEILQGYLEDGLGTRLRDEQAGDDHTYLQTRKTGSGVSRTEDEYAISKDTFDEFWESVECSLTKTRYFVTYDGIEIEFNVFHGNLEGYFQIEVEFATNEEAVNFVPPSWIGREVTDDKEHGNYQLAKNGIPL